MKFEKVLIFIFTAALAVLIFFQLKQEPAPEAKEVELDDLLSLNVNNEFDISPDGMHNAVKFTTGYRRMSYIMFATRKDTSWKTHTIIPDIEKSEEVINPMCFGFSEDSKEFFMLLEGNEKTGPAILRTSAAKPVLKTISCGKDIGIKTFLTAQGDFAVFCSEVYSTQVYSTIDIFNFKTRTWTSVPFENKNYFVEYAAALSLTAKTLAVIERDSISGTTLLHTINMEDKTLKPVLSDTQFKKTKKLPGKPRFHEDGTFSVIDSKNIYHFNADGSLIDSFTCAPALCSIEFGTVSSDRQNAALIVAPPDAEKYLALMNIPEQKIIGEYEISSYSMLVPPTAKNDVWMWTESAIGTSIFHASPNNVERTQKSWAASFFIGAAVLFIWFFISCLRSKKRAHTEARTASENEKKGINIGENTSGKCSACGFSLTEQGLKEAKCSVCGSSYATSFSIALHKDSIHEIWLFSAIALGFMGVILAFLTIPRYFLTSSEHRYLFTFITLGSMLLLFFILFLNLPSLKKPGTVPADKKLFAKWKRNPNARIQALAGGLIPEVYGEALDKLYGSNLQQQLDSFLALNTDHDNKNKLAKSFIDHISDKDILLQLLDKTKFSSKNIERVLKKLDDETLLKAALGSGSVSSIEACHTFKENRAYLEKIEKEAALEETRKYASKAIEEINQKWDDEVWEAIKNGSNNIITEKASSPEWTKERIKKLRRKDISAAHHAARSKNIKALKFIAGLDSEFLSMCDSKKRTPAHTAAYQLWEEGLNFIIEKNPADAEMTDDTGRTPRKIYEDLMEEAQAKMPAMPFAKLALPAQEEVKKLVAFFARSLDAKLFVTKAASMGFTFEEENMIGAFFVSKNGRLALKAGKGFRTMDATYAPHINALENSIPLVESMGNGTSRPLYSSITKEKKGQDIFLPEGAVEFIVYSSSMEEQYDARKKFNNAVSNTYGCPWSSSRSYKRNSQSASYDYLTVTMGKYEQMTSSFEASDTAKEIFTSILPGKNPDEDWNLIVGEKAVTNFAPPGYDITDFSLFDKLVAEIQDGLYELEELIKP